MYARLKHIVKAISCYKWIPTWDSWLVGKKKNKIKYACSSCQRKERIKGKLHEFYYIFGGSNIFLPKKYVIAGNIYGMSEEKNKKKAE